MPASIQPFTRNASCPNRDTFTLSHRHHKNSSSATNLSGFAPRPSTVQKKRGLLQRLKTRLWKFFQPHRTNEPTPAESSFFSFDPEVDLREEHLSLLSEHLSDTLRLTTIDVDRLRNIARQCLIMSAEEPFGILGAQIRLELHLVSKKIHSLPLIRLNPKQKTIFEIEIHLDEDPKVFTFKRLLPALPIFDELKERSPLHLAPRCSLIKRVFYKTAEPKRAFLDS